MLLKMLDGPSVVPSMSARLHGALSRDPKIKLGSFM